MCVCLGGWGGGGMRRELSALQLHNYYYKPLMPLANFIFFVACWQEIGHTHMRIAEGVQSLLQMSGLLARLCQKAASPDQLAQWRTQHTSSVSVSSFTCALKRMTVSLCFCELVYLYIEKDNDPQVWVSACLCASVFLWVCLPAHWKKQPTSLGFCELVYLCTEKNMTHKFSFCEPVYLCIKNNKFAWGNVFKRNTTTHKFGFWELVYLCIGRGKNRKFAYLWACLLCIKKRKKSLFTSTLRKTIHKFGFCEFVYLCIKKK